jgi:hypothetical protein
MLKVSENEAEALFVLNDLRDEDKCELKALYGRNWKKKTLLSIKDKKFYVLYGYNKEKQSVPVAIGDFCQIFPEDSSVACVWLLTSKNIYRNKLLFLREFIPLFKRRSLEYDIMFNFIYKSNIQAKRWLQKFGFKFDNPHPKGIEVKDGFEFFYKTKERK